MSFNIVINRSLVQVCSCAIINHHNHRILVISLLLRFRLTHFSGISLLRYFNLSLVLNRFDFCLLVIIHRPNFLLTLPSLHLNNLPLYVILSALKYKKPAIFGRFFSRMIGTMHDSHNIGIYCAVWLIYSS